MGGSTWPHRDGRHLPAPSDQPAGLLAPFAQRLGAADVAFANLEGVLADPRAPGLRPKCDGARPRCFAFRMPPAFAETLAAAGFDVVSLANNHAHDFGPAGLDTTRAALTRAGLIFAGAAGEVARLAVRGQRLAILATATQWTPGWDVNAPADLLAAIAGEDAAGAIVIVSFHAGGEGPAYVHTPHGRERFIGLDRGDVRAFARAAVAAGADLVLGHGPHVPRGLELIDGRLVAYSLGNFFTFARFLLDGPRGHAALLEAHLAPDGRLVGGRLHAGLQLEPGGPLPDPTGAAIALIRDLSAADFPESALVIHPDGRLEVPPPP